MTDHMQQPIMNVARTDVATLHEKLDCLVPLHGHDRVGAWKALVDAGRWDALVERLLLDHYDPAYLRSIGRNFMRSPQARPLVLASDDPAAHWRQRWP